MMFFFSEDSPIISKCQSFVSSNFAVLTWHCSDSILLDGACISKKQKDNEILKDLQTGVESIFLVPVRRKDHVTGQL